MKRTPLFQLVSDVHIEFPDVDNIYPPLPKLSPILILAGDIGSFTTENSTKKLEKFLLDQSDLFDIVLFVSGNHEFYGSEYSKTLRKLQEIADKRENLYFLEKSSFLYEKFKIRFIGSCLWSTVPHDCEKLVTSQLNDYKHIQIKVSESETRKLRVSDTNQFFEEDVNFFKTEILKSEKNGEHVILISHHAPLMKGTSEKKYEDPRNKIRHAFASDLSQLLKPPVICYCFGHTHFSTNFEYNNIKILSNQLGYLTWYDITQSGYHHGFQVSMLGEKDSNEPEDTEFKKFSLVVDYDISLDEKVKKPEKVIVLGSTSEKPQEELTNSKKSKCITM